MPLNKSLSEKATVYYLEQDYNCAESLLRACNEEYQLHLDVNALKLASGLGKGMGAERTCGVLIIGEMVIGHLFVKERAHATEGFSELCNDFLSGFEKHLCSIECSHLRFMNLTEETRCLKTLVQAADHLEKFVKERR